ncbi:hypothetical protein QYE76_041668 [Lolium multiflorum]|uniref:TF-B3 domain-containing protein n=1 Tax=Lolium multiflorum TaxID=4521 RepID=A0AAD8WU76_LOLMU|nr:hypothetical protein QYE76_041668 [Lolium multiflorum]
MSSAPPEFRIQRNSLAKKPKVTGRRDAAIQRCILKGRGKGRPKRVGHSADPPQPSRFYVQLDGNDDMYMLVIPREFKQCLKGILPRPIKLKTSVGCAWYVHIDEYQGELVLKDGWFGFAEAHELQLDDLLVFECSNKKLKLGESLSWKETSVEPAPVCKVFRRIDEENTADSFCKVLCTSELEVITIPSRVLPWFYGGCPKSINLKMSTACTWIVDLKQQDGNVLMDAGWPEFVKAHDLKVGYLLTFKKLDTKSLQVLIFGYNCCEKCSNKKLKLGESLSWKETSVEPAPVCKVFRRIDEENTADSFCKVLCTSELEVITIPSRVLPWFYGGCPKSINLKMSTACTWIVDLKQQDDNVLMDAGWPEFVKAHDLKVGYLLTFKKLDTKSLQVLIFGYNCCEKVIWCSGYHPSLGQQNESQLY